MYTTMREAIEARMAKIPDPRRRMRQRSVYEEGMASPFVIDAVRDFDGLLSEMEDALADAVFVLANQTFQLSFSSGAILLRSPMTLDEAIAEADRALLAKKETSSAAWKKTGSPSAGRQTETRPWPASPRPCPR